MILSVLIVQIQAQLRDIYFSQNNSTQLTNYSVALFELRHASVIQCADLCFCNNCCKELIFNTASHQCIGLHFPDFNSNANLITIPLYEGNVTYQKGKFQQHYFTNFFINLEYWLFCTSSHNCANVFLLLTTPLNNFSSPQKNTLFLFYWNVLFTNLIQEIWTKYEADLTIWFVVHKHDIFINTLRMYKQIGWYKQLNKTFKSPSCYVAS